MYGLGATMGLAMFSLARHKYFASTFPPPLLSIDSHPCYQEKMETSGDGLGTKTTRSHL